ncbi:MAG: ABC transporter ATP-binding protein [Eggerthella sp.]|nr:ABC transporter ATP-binding protein [Eggerthella sp.]
MKSSDVVRALAPADQAGEDEPLSALMYPLRFLGMGLLIAWLCCTHVASIFPGDVFDPALRSAFDTGMRIGDIIAEPIITNNILPKDQVEDRVNELLERVGLANYMRNRYPHEFSGGQRQRVGIARALAVNPKLIVCDEPVSALDVSIQAQVLNLLDELKEQFGLTYLFIAHGLNVVKHVSDRVGVMYLGKMMEIAPKNALYADPLSPYTQALLSAIPSVDPAAKKERIILEGDVPSPIDPPPGCRFASRCFAKVNGCDEVMPPLVEVKPDHCVACHRYDKGGPGTAVI